MSEDNLLLLVGASILVVSIVAIFFLLKRRKLWLIAHLSILSIYSLFFLYLLLSSQHGEEAFVAWGYWLIVMCIHEVMLLLGAVFSGLVRFFKG